MTKLTVEFNVLLINGGEIHGFAAYILPCFHKGTELCNRRTKCLVKELEDPVTLTQKSAIEHNPEPVLVTSKNRHIFSEIT